MSKLSRNKGNAFERKVAKILSEWSGVELRRTPQSGGWGEDDRVSGDLVALNTLDFPLHVECKKQEAFSWEATLQNKGIVYDWWKQVEKACPKNKIPVVVFSKNRGNIWIMFPRLMFAMGDPSFVMPEVWVLANYWFGIIELSVFCKMVNYNVAKQGVIRQGG